MKHGKQNQILAPHRNPFGLQSDSRQTVRLAATLAAKRLDANRRQSTPTEHRRSSQAQIDTDREVVPSGVAV